MYNGKMGSVPYEITGRDVDECRAKLYEKYGDAFSIVNFRTDLRGGFLGLWQKEIVRVQYFVDERLLQMKELGQSLGGQRGSIKDATVYPRNPALTGASSNSYQNGYSPYGNRPVSPQSSQASFDNNKEALLKKLSGGSDLSKLVQIADLTKKIENLDTKIDQLKDASSNKTEHETIKVIERMLRENEYTESYIEKIKTRIKSELSLDNLDDFELVQGKVVEWLGESVEVADKFAGKGCHVIIIVGPTGVGKTTTVARMAAKLKKSAKDNNQPGPVIRMVTIDNMRVGAFVQLENYGRIMDIPVDKAESAEDLTSIFNMHKSKTDFMFIDTSGYSPRDFENLAKMHKVLDVDGMRPDIYLAFSASTKAKDLVSIIKNFESFDFRSVIITKCDETMSYGNVLSVLAEKNKKISWVTTGQTVMHSLERAHPLFFLKNLTGFQVDREKIMEKYGPEENVEV